MNQANQPEGIRHFASNVVIIMAKPLYFLSFFAPPLVLAVPRNSFILFLRCLPVTSQYILDPDIHSKSILAWCVDIQKRRTLLPAGLLDLGSHAISHEPVAGLELLHRLGAVVDERKASALAATEVCLEAEDRHIVLLGLV